MSILVFMTAFISGVSIGMCIAVLVMGKEKDK